MLPSFAQPIVDARAAGQRPVEMVIVSDGNLGLHRRYRENPVVVVRPEHRPRELEWRFLAGLDVEIATHDTGGRMLELVSAIDRAHPYYLRVWHIPTDNMMRVRFCGLRMICKESEWACGSQ